jgi:hypothetical protein
LKAVIRGREKRNAKRINYICEIQCEGQGIKQLNTRINDISTTGLFIDSISCLPVGSVLNMKFSVLGVMLEVAGMVRHSILQSGMGIEFTNLRADQSAVIECLVEGKPLNSIPFYAAAKESPQPHNKGLPDQDAGAEEPPILMGNFAIISFFDVIQMIENSKITGTLLIQSPQAKGEIYFNEGLIANAKSNLNYGITALNKFLNVAQGKFEFKQGDREHVCAIRATSNTGLLLDLLAAQDEEAAYS